MTITVSHRNNNKVLQSNPIEAVGVVTGGGANANCTIATGCRGITSVNHSGSSGSGAYSILFNEVGENFLGAWFTVVSATGASTSYIVKVVSYTVATKILLVEVADLATPSLHDLATTEQLYVRAMWSDSDAA